MMLEFGIYTAASCFLLLDTRKFNADFSVMVVHHVVTLTLLYLGWNLKFYNISIATAALHDVSEMILEYSKIFYYKNMVKTSNTLFCIFAIAFMSTRLYVFPKYFIIPWYNG